MTIKSSANERKRNRQSGFTLIELIITIGLLSIILGIIFSFQSFGTKVFNKGVTQSDIQSTLRLASDFIIKDVRNATEIMLTTPANPNDYNQIYVSGNKLKYKPFGGTTIDKTDAIIQNPSTDLQFSLVQIGSKYTLDFSINGKNQGNAYTLASSVMLNNIETATTLTNSQSIYYKKGISAPVPVPANAQLSNLTLSSGTLTPAFDSSITYYTVSLPHGTTIPPTIVTATGKDGATVSSITDAASLPGTATIQVTSADGTRSATYTIEFILLPSNEQIIQDALDTLAVLSVSNAGNKNNQAKPTINLPASINGIAFSFISRTVESGAAIAIPSGEVTRHGSDHKSGTITLQGSLNGATITKVFDVYIPSNHGSPGDVTVTE
ncbi:MAG: hypothetical protein K0R93_1390 [Anaerosolibacter sp.]|uniref:prepilin-type N-terminal cleavage/methylation domain-containing protein n=1 Tax=Anaerosolibacter sp. TaxID=1872527 RepID=UPI00261E00F9|nr:prepilin-type N-terminal cleavage/methylation domain-containing protein [Anaerosolibacter sp.]MDF2546492.1 hypothetical protein [Anaerosolibacter sp.]